MKRCSYCGKKISEFAINCPFCGSSLPEQTKQGAEKTVPKRFAFAVKSNTDLITDIALSTVFAFIIPLMWVWITGNFCSAYGENMQSVFFANAKASAIKNLIILIGSGVTYFVVIKIVARKKIPSIMLITVLSVIFCVVQFLALDTISKTVMMAIAVYFVPRQIVRAFAVAFGCGTAILQGALLAISMNGQRKFRSIAVVSMMFLCFSVIGSFVGLLVFPQSIIHGILYALCGCIAAVIATAIIAQRKLR